MKPSSDNRDNPKRRKKARKKLQHVPQKLAVNTILSKNSNGSSNWEQLSKVLGYCITKKNSVPKVNLPMDLTRNHLGSALADESINKVLKTQPKSRTFSRNHMTSNPSCETPSNFNRTVAARPVRDFGKPLHAVRNETRDPHSHSNVLHLKSETHNFSSNSKNKVGQSPLTSRNENRYPQSEPNIPYRKYDRPRECVNGNSNSDGAPSTHRGPTRAVSMDCEMVGTGENGTDSMVARVSLVNKWGDCLYDAYVKPMETITDYRTAVSGIRPSDLTKGKDLFTVQREVQEILDDRILVGHALKNDLDVLFISHPKTMIRDTSRYLPFRQLFNGKTPSLKNLAERLLGAHIQTGEHNSVEDAQAAMAIYLLHKREWENSIKFLKKKRKYHQQQHPPQQ